MSITPLDLQTLFMKMANVGKEQAAIQKSVEHQQEREADHIVKQENSRDHSVNRTEADKEVEKSKDSNDKKNSKNEEFKSSVSEEDKEEEKINYFTDPDRGHNIDISG
eukprot:Anaeramoba_ignava/a616399_95.p3 GENE.a616399_95~~a616399_95.p3  ORF type:complete len:108 (+),score=15.94 a616399_95:180-503(+)